MAATEYFPGSRRPIVSPEVSREQKNSLLDTMGKDYKIGGVEQRLFTIGELAQILNRKPGTIRKWEQDGVLPKATFIRPGRQKDLRGRRRLYSHLQVMGILAIAREEGILDPAAKKPIAKTNFSDRVFTLFRGLSTK